jgi:MYXO-CTERM domain-containing protein
VPNRLRLGVLALGLLPCAAWANSGGIAGYSGLNKTTCTFCHKSNLPAILPATLSGPSFLQLGAKGAFTFALPITATLAKGGGLDVAATGGTLSTVATEPQTKILTGEVVHSAPKAPGGGIAGISWKFDWTAPMVGGTYTLYGAGILSNGNSATTGDSLATDTFQVVVGSCQTHADCDDKNICTNDVCNTQAHTCSNTPIANCCQTVADCDDTNACTTDGCSAQHLCTHQHLAGCCSSDKDCPNDINPCTKNGCDLATKKCVTSKVPGCCTIGTGCDDGNKCTTDSCNYLTSTCSYTPIKGCCKADTDCADSNACTTDTCVVATGICSNTKTPSCCTAASECDDKSICTVDACASNTCTHTPVPGCCLKDADCNDKNPCTTDKCANNNTCTHAAVPGCVPPDAGPPVVDAKPPVGDSKPPVGDSKPPAADGAQPGTDAAQPGTDARIPPAGDSASTNPPGSGGCCRVSHAEAPTFPALLLLGFALLLALRRRR